MINIEDIKTQLDPKDLIDRMKSISKGSLANIEKVIGSDKIYQPISIKEKDKPSECFNLVNRDASGGDLFAVEKILERIRKVTDYIRFPEYPEDMQKVLGDINRLVRFTRHYSIMTPDIEFCQKHSIFVVKYSTSSSNEHAFILPIEYKPVMVNSRRILSPNLPMKRLNLVLPCFTSLAKREDGTRYLSFSVNRENIKIVTSGGRSFRTYNSFYYRGSMRVHSGLSVETFGSPYDIVGMRDQVQNFINNIQPDLVGGVPNGYPAISDFVLERGDEEEVENERSGRESEDAYVSLSLDGDLENLEGSVEDVEVWSTDL